MRGLHKLFLIVLLAAGLLAGGLQIPVVMAQKDKAHDKQVVEDLQRISSAIEASSNDNNGKLPTSLAAAKPPAELKDRLANYKYAPKVDGVSYQLCATFKTDASSSNKTFPATDMAYYGSGPDVENHKMGEQCFTYTITSRFNFDDYYKSLNSSSRSSNSSAFSDIQSKADDSELKTNVNSIAAQLEGYFAMEGMYPTLAQLNDAAWRETNEVTLQSGVLSGGKLKDSYSYVTSTGSCDGVDSEEMSCVKFTLSVKLSDGTTYTRKSSN